MKILFYGINYAPELTGIGKYSGELCEWLSFKGHDVRVVTAPPYYPAWKISAGYAAWKYRVESHGNVRVFRCPLWVPRIQSGRNRILHLVSFMLSTAPVTLLIALIWRPKVVIVIEPPVACAPPALLAASLCGAVSWLHIQDLEIDAAVNSGLLKPSGLLAIVYKMEHWLLRRFDRVSSITKSMLNKLFVKGLKSTNSYLFPNWVDTSNIRPLLGTSPMRSELDIDVNKVVALYSGSMGSKQGLEIIIEAAQLLQDNADILFVLCGDGSKRGELEQASKSLRNILMLPLQPANRLNDLLNLADLHLLPQLPGMEDLVMPSKLLGMLASGRPIISCVKSNTELGEVVSSVGCVVPPGDATNLAEAILDLATNTEKRAILGKKGRDFCAAALEKEVVLTAFENELNSLVGERVQSEKTGSN